MAATTNRTSMKKFTTQGAFNNQLLIEIEQACGRNGIHVAQLRALQDKKGMYEKKCNVHFEVLKKSPIMYNAAAQARVLRMSESTIADRLTRVNR